MRCNAPDPAGGANSALPDQTSWLDLGERKGRGKGSGKGKERAMGKEGERKMGVGVKRGEERRRGQREGREEEGKRKGGICAVVIFPRKKPATR